MPTTPTAPIRMTFARLLALTCGVLVMLLAPTAHAVASVPPPHRLGGLDLGAYCRAQGNTDAVLEGSTAYDWHCVTPSGGRSIIYFDDACRRAYPGLTVIDRIGDYRDPRSVSCWRVMSPSPVTPDIDTYCRLVAKHGGSLLSDRTVYGWKCADFSRAGVTTYPINMAEVCRWASGGYPAIDRFADYANPRSWQCLL